MIVALLTCQLPPASVRLFAVRFVLSLVVLFGSLVVVVVSEAIR